MEKVNYANIANNLLGNELYYKFITDIAKEHNNINIVDYGKKVAEKLCEIIVAIGISNKFKLDNIKICLENEIVEVSCKEFAMKYSKYLKENKLEATI